MRVKWHVFIVTNKSLKFQVFKKVTIFPNFAKSLLFDVLFSDLRLTYRILDILLLDLTLYEIVFGLQKFINAGFFQIRD